MEEEMPNPPKRPLTAFFLFKERVFSDTKKANPDSKVTEITKIISERWNNMDDTEKSEYEAMYNKAREIYQRDFEAYQATIARNSGARNGRGNNMFQNNANESESDSDD